MFLFVTGSIPPVIFGLAETDPVEISIPAVTYTNHNYQSKSLYLKITYVYIQYKGSVFMYSFYYKLKDIRHFSK